MRKNMSIWRNILLGIVVSASVMWLLLYSPTPFVVYEPGIAVSVESMIEIGEGEQLPSEGEWLITAVKLKETNFIEAIGAAFNTDASVKVKKAVFQGQSKQEYAQYLNVVMNQSQYAAVEAAYRYLELPYVNQLSAILVTELEQRYVHNEKVSRSASLQVGDQLLGIVDEQAFLSLDDMVARLKPQQKSQYFPLEVMRDGELLIIVAELQLIEDTDWTIESLASQLAIAQVTETRKLVPERVENKVTIRASEIGGPSAGFVFALQIVDLLLDEDLTRGLTVAATGTISETGQVGAIGGIEQKVAITSKQGADIFFVPKLNEPTAKKKAKAIGTNMQVIGVQSLHEAIDIMHQQPVKR